MEIFDIHRRDIFDFDTYMDLKKPGFGGPSSAKNLRDSKGNKIDKNPKLDGYQHTVERHKAFSHPVFDPTYKAMSNDLVYKQEKKEPLNYGDPMLTGIPTVDAKDYEAMKESRTLNFSEFINEEKKTKAPKKCKCEDKCTCKKEEKKMNESHFDDEFFHDYTKEFGLNPNDEEIEDPNEEESEENSRESFEPSTDFREEHEEEEEHEEDLPDEFEKPEELEENPEEKGPSKKDIEEIEKLLRGYEDHEEDDFDDRGADER